MAESNQRVEPNDNKILTHEFQHDIDVEISANNLNEEEKKDAVEEFGK